MTHFEISNTSYGQKKGHESNWQFDSRPLKVGNRPYFLTIRWCETYHSKALDKGYNFAFDLISIGGLHTKLWAPKVAGVLVVRILGLRQNDIWVLVLWLGTKYTIRGKVVTSVKPRSWWVLWIRVCSWLICAPRCSNYTLTNLLFSLCRFVWVNEMFINLPNPILEL
jgi:hypothetical protein